MEDLIADIGISAYLFFTGCCIGWRGDYTLINKWHHIVVPRKTAECFAAT